MMLIFCFDILWYFSFPFKVRCSEPSKIATAHLSLIPGSDEGSCLKDQESFQFWDYVISWQDLQCHCTAPCHGFIFNMEQTHYSMICKHNTMSENISCCFFTDMGNSCLSDNVEDCVCAPCSSGVLKQLLSPAWRCFLTLWRFRWQNPIRPRQSGFRMITLRHYISPSQPGEWKPSGYLHLCALVKDCSLSLLQRAFIWSIIFISYFNLRA